jgi:general secretion pathway protein A
MDNTLDFPEVTPEQRDQIAARFGFEVSPFGPVETTSLIKDRFFFPSHQHLRALGFVGQLLWSRINLAAIISDHGMGKSLLIRRLRADLDPRVLIAHVQSHSEHDPESFLLDVLKQFGMQLERNDRGDRRRMLAMFLQHQYHLNRLCLLVVEGVNKLRPPVLDELRVIAELQSEDQQRIVKMLLMGTAPLQHIIDAPRMKSMSEGRAPRITLECFGEDQVAAYVVHRLRSVGAKNPDAIVSPKLLTAIHRYSAGRPELINQLCDLAFVYALENGETAVSQQSLDRAAERIGLRPSAMPRRVAETDSSGAASSSAVMVDEPALLILTIQGGADGVIPLLANRMLIGRAEDAEVRIDSAFVSRYHAILLRDPVIDSAGIKLDRDILIDLGSTNGIVVNGKRFRRHVLKHRDLIQIGMARITYLNPTLAPAVESDPSETLNFASGANESDGGDPSIFGFGRMDDAS